MDLENCENCVIRDCEWAEFNWNCGIKEYEIVILTWKLVRIKVYSLAQNWFRALNSSSFFCFSCIYQSSLLIQRQDLCSPCDRTIRWCKIDEWVLSGLFIWSLEYGLQEFFTHIQKVWRCNLSYFQLWICVIYSWLQSV